MQLRPKYALMHLARYSGVNSLSRRVLRKRLLVLCYHGVVPSDHRKDRYLYRNTVSAREFDAQLGVLTRFFRPIAVSDLLDWQNGRAPAPEHAVLVTFDDGYRNNLTHGAALLERHGVPALVSVSTGYIGGGRILWPQEIEVRVLYWPRDALPMPGNEPDRPLGRDLQARMDLSDYIRNLCKRLPDDARRVYLERLRQEEPKDGPVLDEELCRFLSWDEVRTLRRRGFEIGSHGVEHPIFTRIPREALSHELRESKATIERELGTECSSIVYPNGGREDFSPDVVANARAAGYRLGFTLTGRLNLASQDRLTLDRVGIPGHMPLCVFQSLVSGIHYLLGRS